MNNQNFLGGEPPTPLSKQDFSTPACIYPLKFTFFTWKWCHKPSTLPLSILTWSTVVCCDSSLFIKIIVSYHSNKLNWLNRINNIDYLKQANVKIWKRIRYTLMPLQPENAGTKCPFHKHFTMPLPNPGGNTTDE